MSAETEERIRARAHEIWEAQGHPEGLAEEHWAQASAEIAALDGGGSEAALPNPLATGASAAELAKPKRGRNPPPA
ncbi:DUF2934 domain-containing protein [Sphingobium amiense]|uniref:DUF2934 domain-containing protein n=1 Tax=Sphingobium amiense TaxID=135719 RepID=UPI00082E256B|nr:DUF2934 domain-containing protein [Sphingobium amiense]